MDMSQFNGRIMTAKPEDDTSGDGPFFRDGTYLMVISGSEEGHGDSEQMDNGEWPKVILAVSFVACDGPRSGKEFTERYGLRHPSAFYVSKGALGLQKLYRAINMQPKEFSEAHGQRVLITLKSKPNLIKGTKDVNPMFPWNTEIIGYDPAPVSKSQPFEEVVQSPTPQGPPDYPTGKVAIPNADIPF